MDPVSWNDEAMDIDFRDTLDRDRCDREAVAFLNPDQTIGEAPTMANSSDVTFLQAAIEEAKAGLAEGGIPIGSVLVIDGEIVGRGHNRRVQRGSAILHAEMDAIENAGRLNASDYRRATLYSTLSPCDMCSGTALLYRIPRIVIGENRTFQGPEEYVRTRGVILEIVDDAECVRLMENFIRTYPTLWNEDIGESAGASTLDA
jgi:cytosine deaminase